MENFNFSNPIDWSGFVLIIIFCIVGGIMFESKKSWEEGHYVGPRNGVVFMALFLSFVVCVMWYIILPSNPQRNYIDFNINMIFRANLLYFFGLGIFYLTMRFKKRRLKAKNLL